MSENLPVNTYLYVYTNMFDRIINPRYPKIKTVRTSNHNYSLYSTIRRK